MNIKSLTIIAFVNSILAVTSQAAAISIALDQSASGTAGATAIDLTADGALDWGTWQDNGNGTLDRTMSGGSGFTSLGLLGGAVYYTTSAFTNAENEYSWTNGTPTATGSDHSGSRAVLGSNGRGVRLTIDVAAAGTYQLKFYTTTAGVNLAGTATLTTGAVSDTVSGTVPTVLQKYEYTVDFTTDGADTLSLDVVKDEGPNDVFAFEAFTLKSINNDPNLTIETDTALSNDGSLETFQLPYTNSGITDALTITSVTTGGADAAYFTVNSFTSPVASGASGNIDFSFNPSDGERTYNGTLTIVSNDPNTPSKVINLTIAAYAINLGKILCIGDSITEANANRTANDGGWSWRYAFWKHMVDANIGYEFVGTRTANKNGSSVYPDYTGLSFVNHHEAIWGTSSLNRADNAPIYLGTLKTQGKTPDTAIIYCGGNDIPINLSVSAETVRDRIKTIVDHLQGDLGASGNSNMRILLVSVIPRFTGTNKDTPDVRNTTRFTEINNLLAVLAPAETTATSKVTYLDIFPLFNNNNTNPVLLYDGVHPNSAGEQIEADEIFSTLVPDSDNDAMNDRWELLHFATIAAGDPAADDDSDGISNLDEFILGFSPTAHSSPQKISVSPDNSQISFTLSATSGIGYEELTRRYALYSSSDLENWNLEQEGNATGSTVNFPATVIGSRVFYRLEVALE